MVKTNAMRLLDSAKIKYDLSEYEVDESDLSGVHGAEMLGIDPDCMFKTLVCADEKGEHEVFLIPVAYELDLKKCAALAGVKRVEMIHVKDSAHAHRICQRRMLSHRYEEKIPDLHRRNCSVMRAYLCKRGNKRCSAYSVSHDISLNMSERNSGI